MPSETHLPLKACRDSSGDQRLAPAATAPQPLALLLRSCCTCARDGGEARASGTVVRLHVGRFRARAVVRQYRRRIDFGRLPQATRYPIGKHAPVLGKYGLKIVMRAVATLPRRMPLHFWGLHGWHSPTDQRKPHEQAISSPWRCSTCWRAGRPKSKPIVDRP